MRKLMNELEKRRDNSSRLENCEARETQGTRKQFQFDFKSNPNVYELGKRHKLGLICIAKVSSFGMETFCEMNVEIGY